MLQQYCCCRRRPEELPKPIDDETPSVQTTSSEKDRSTPRDSEQVKEMSAGMVNFITKVVPKIPKAKERRYEMDHVNGIRLETRTPPYHATNGSR